MKGHKRAIIKDEKKYFSIQQKVLEYRNYAKIHPLNGFLTVDHSALPPIGWMNQDFIFTEDLLKIFNVYNQVLSEKEKSKSSKKSKGKSKK
ncbi:MAG: hypothetical protein ACRC92_21730 [Peptostreptococcaceae bacterium]